MSQTTFATIAAETINATRDELASPSHDAWNAVPATTVQLEPTPLDRQPSVYVRRSWEGKSHGSVSEATVQAAIAEGALHLRVSWATPSPRRRVSDNDVYADACGILLPADGRTAELSSMGSPESPVAAWYWRAGLDEARSATATGLGTVERDPATSIRAIGELHGNEWQVVFSRDIEGHEPVFSGDEEIPIGFAVWCGANDERAGLKSHTPVWHRLAVS